MRPPRKTDVSGHGDDNVLPFEGEQAELVGDAGITVDMPDSPGPSAGGGEGAIGGDGRSEAAETDLGGVTSFQEFFLPINGFVWFTSSELKVINHPSFQRLAKINQLGFAHLVFRGATHKRIEHVLGAVGVAERMISAVNSNARTLRNRLTPCEQRFVRLGALLHDIGHIASGHTIEDELGIVGKHDEDERLSIVFRKTDWSVDSRGAFSVDVPELSEASGVSRESLAEVIDREFALPDGLEGVAAHEIIWLLIRKPPEARSDAGLEADLRSDLEALRTRHAQAKDVATKESLGPDIELKDLQLNLHAKQQKLEEHGEIRFSVCSNMIGNTICADLLDYISRDWFHVGKPLALEDRIYQYMEIQEGLQPSGEAGSRSADRFVVSLGEDTKIRRDGVSAILSLLERRYELAETVLYHKTKLAAGAMLDRALFEISQKTDKHQLVNDVLCLSDEQLLDYAIVQAGKLRRGTKARNAAVRLLSNLRARVLPSRLISFDSSRHPEEREYLQGLYSSFANDPAEAAANRARTARQLEWDFQIPDGSIVMSCSIVKPKIAKVAIRVNDDVEEFKKYEDKHKDKLSGGHLTAQVERFERLWRLDFFIDRSLVDAESEFRLSDDELHLIADTIKYVVASTSHPAERFRQAKRIARELAELKQGRKGAPQFINHIYADAAKSASGDQYANGSNVISYFLRSQRQG